MTLSHVTCGVVSLQLNIKVFTSGSFFYASQITKVLLICEKDQLKTTITAL